MTDHIHIQDDTFYVGVDVGTGSARACIVNSQGDILSMSEKPISREELIPDHITQSSTEIWHAVCFCVKDIIKKSKIDAKKIKGIGFDATCSLVVVDVTTNETIGVGPKFTNNDQNVVLWMDHRAVEETKEINNTDDKCLKYVGGQMSIEMEIPKIKWLKNNIPEETFSNCKYFDLPDYLTFLATGKETRSFCSVVCKQGFLPMGVEGSIDGWSKEFLENIGLLELCENEYYKLGGALSSQSNKGKLSSNFQSAGEHLGKLSTNAAIELGLTVECIVSSGIIDAYAGWIGTVAAKANFKNNINTVKHNNILDSTGRLAIVAGTSTCHILLSKEPHFVQGVWGPYRDVLFKGLWCSEGGQSCTGALLSHIINIHPAYPELMTQAKQHQQSHFDFLNTILETLVTERKERSVLSLIRHLFLYGDYHGNRSPLANPEMRAAIIGLSMDVSINDLALKYAAACEFIAQQTRHIIETMTKYGHTISALYISGGQCRNYLLMNMIANATGYPVIIPRYIDSAVVFGSAILGAAASISLEFNQDIETVLWQTMKRMTKFGHILEPSSVSNPDRILLDIKYKIFLDMAEKQIEYRTLVDDIDYLQTN